MKKCDGATEYTCVVEHLEESGEVRHWHGPNLAETKKAYQTRPPDFVHPFEREHTEWPKECDCPPDCRRFVRDSNTLERRGARKAWIRSAAGGQVIEEGIKTVVWSRIEVKFICATVEREQTAQFDLEDASLEDTSPGFARELFAMDFEAAGRAKEKRKAKRRR